MPAFVSSFRKYSLTVLNIQHELANFLVRAERRRAKSLRFIKQTVAKLYGDRDQFNELVRTNLRYNVSASECDSDFRYAHCVIILVDVVRCSFQRGPLSSAQAFHQDASSDRGRPIVIHVLYTAHLRPVSVCAVTPLRSAALQPNGESCIQCWDIGRHVPDNYRRADRLYPHLQQTLAGALCGVRCWRYHSLRDIPPYMALSHLVCSVRACAWAALGCVSCGTAAPGSSSG